MVAELTGDGGRETIDAIDELNRADVVIVQHEYGIYDGPDGETIVPSSKASTGRRIVVAHTVLEHPTQHQRLVLEAIVRAADAVVVMTEAGRVSASARVSTSTSARSLSSPTARRFRTRFVSRTPRRDRDF